MLNSKLNRQLKLVLCACLMSYIQFVVGCSFIFSSILLAELSKPDSPILINSEDASWIASIPTLICPVGLLVIGILTDKIGRRKALQVAYVPIIVSWIIIAYADSVKTIIIGRVILGTTMGSGCCAFLYLGEICPTKYRPLYFSVTTVFVGVGMLTECTLALFLHWQTVSLILVAISVAGCLSLFLLPETPMWLRANGRVREAEDAEKWLGMDAPAAATTTATAVTACSGIDDGADCCADDPSAPYWTLFARASVWKPTLITTAFFVCQQGSGFYVLLFYSVDVLRDTKVQWDGVTVTVFLSAARVLGSLVFSSLHHVGRKTLVVVSSTGMAVCLIVIIGYMRLYKDVVEPPYPMVSIVAFILYVFFALLAILPLPWTLCNEVFPMAVKGVMSGVVQVCGYELMFIVIKIYPFLVSRFGIEDVWSVFAAFCIISAFYGAFIMPETKGKSLNEILISFEKPQKSMKNSLP